MKEMLSYRGYYGSIAFSNEDMLFHGKVIGIKSLLSYEGNSAQELVSDFQNAIDEYLEQCSGMGLEPEKPFKGSFNVRIAPELHRAAALLASQRGESLNAFVEEAIANEASRQEAPCHVMSTS
jgi:predicted HicB family RNase H-like nuclease